MHVRILQDELVSRVSEATGVSKKDARAVLNEATDIMMSEVVAGKTVPIGKIGRVSYRHREERKGRSPATGQEITIPAGNVPKISWGAALKKALSES